jgi:hypothetical protein
MSEFDTQIDVVWEGTVDDGRFACKVERIDQDHGRLTARVAESGEVLLDKTVALYFGAVFGPDVSDLGQWMPECIAAIDAWIAKQ